MSDIPSSGMLATADSAAAVFVDDPAAAARASGSAKAYQAVAQATALAIQDATDTLRNMSTVSTVAVGTAMSNYIATGDQRWVDAVHQAQRIADQAASTFMTVGTNAKSVLEGFPAGDTIGPRAAPRRRIARGLDRRDGIRRRRCDPVDRRPVAGKRRP